MSTTITAAAARAALRRVYKEGFLRPSQRVLATSLGDILGRPVSQPSVNAWLAGTTRIPERYRHDLVAYATTVELASELLRVASCRKPSVLAELTAHQHEWLGVRAN